MADQGEGGIDASDDYEARLATERKNTFDLEMKALAARQQKARRAVENIQLSSNSVKGIVEGMTSPIYSMGGLPEIDMGAQVSPSSERSVGNVARSNREKEIAEQRARIDASSSTQGGGPNQNSIEASLEGVSTGIKAGGAAIAAAFATVAIALGNMQSSRESGASSVASVSESLGASLQDLGVDAKGSTETIRNVEKGGMNGKVGTAQKYAQFIAAAASAKREASLPGRADMKGLDNIYSQYASGKLSWDRAIKAAGNPISSIAPDAALVMANLGGSPQQSGVALEASGMDDNRTNFNFRSQRANYAAGQRQLDISSGLGVIGRDSVPGAILNTVANNGIMRSGIDSQNSTSVPTAQAIADSKHLKEIAKGVNSKPPPSTNPGN